MSSSAAFVCIDGIVPVRSTPDSRSERITDLLFGEEFRAKSERDGHVFGATGTDAVEGFVPRGSLGPAIGPATHRVRRTFIHVYHAPDLQMASGKILPMNALVAVTGRSAAVRYPGGGPGSTVVELRSGGWVTEQGLRPIGHYETDVQMVARMFVAAVYLHGGKTWLGCDASGFIQTVLCACGLSIPRQPRQQIAFFERNYKTPDNDSSLQHVIYSNGCCGFLFGNEVIAARKRSMQVDVSPRERVSIEYRDHPRIFSLTQQRPT